MATQELAIQKKTLPLVEEAKKLSIENDKDMEKAAELLSRLNKGADAVAKDKEKLMRPALDTVNEIRSRYKGVETSLKEGIDYVRRIMTSYRTEQKRIVDEKAAKLEARVGEGKGKLKASTAIEKMADIEQPEESVITDSGMVKFRTVNVFEIENVAEIVKSTGFQYIEVNIKTREVENALKNGEKIPGITYTTEERPVNSR